MGSLSEQVAAMDDGELERLAEALRVGRLRPGLAPDVLDALGMPPRWAALAGAGELVALAQLERARARGRRVELVCTRPRAGGGALLDTAVAVRRLFSQAEREVLIAGFRITEREQLVALERRAGRELDVRLFVDIDPAVSATGARQAPSADAPARWWRQFQAEVWPETLPPPRAWFAPQTLGPDTDGAWSSMHAKCVVVDRRVWFLSSANFTRRAQTRNLELGAWIEDPARANEVVELFEQWVGAGVFVPVPGASCV